MDTHGAKTIVSMLERYSAGLEQEVANSKRICNHWLWGFGYAVLGDGLVASR